MVGSLAFRAEAAAEYDRAFAHVTRYFMPFLLHAANVKGGMRVLDIATGTGLSAEAALDAVSPTGHVTAADISPEMADMARARLGAAPNCHVVVEDGQALPAAMAFAERIARQPPIPVRMTKTTVNRLAHALDDLASHMDSDQNVLTGLTEDYREGTSAFREKRKPAFKGR